MDNQTALYDQDRSTFGLPSHSRLECCVSTLVYHIHISSAGFDGVKDSTPTDGPQLILCRSAGNTASEEERTRTRTRTRTLAREQFTKHDRLQACNSHSFSIYVNCDLLAVHISTFSSVYVPPPVPVLKLILATCI